MKNGLGPCSACSSPSTQECPRRAICVPLPFTGYTFWLAATADGALFTCDTQDDGYAGALCHAGVPAGQAQQGFHRMPPRHCINSTHPHWACFLCCSGCFTLCWSSQRCILAGLTAPGWVGALQGRCPRSASQTMLGNLAGLVSVVAEPVFFVRERGPQQSAA